MVAVICVLITIVIVVIIRKGISVMIYSVVIMYSLPIGFGHQHDEESIPDVQRQEKDINMSKNIVYEQIKWCKQKIVLKENVAYCSTSECVSPYSYVYIQ